LLALGVIDILRLGKRAMNRKQRRATQKTGGAAPARPETRGLFQQAVACQARGMLADAERLCAQVLEADPQHTDSMNLAGIVASQQGRFELALQWLRKAVARAPRSADYHANLALVLRHAGKLEEALAASRKALELNPKHVNALVNLSQLQLDLGDPAGAATSARRALTQQRDHVGALVNLGSALARSTGELDDEDPKRLEPLAEAERALRRALELRPGADVHANLGATLHALGRFEEAAESCRQALRLDPRNASAHNNLGVALFAHGRREEALAAHRQAVALDPRSLDANFSLGAALFKCGEFAAAREALERTLALDPSAAAVHNALAFVLLAQGQLEPGLRELEWRWQTKDSTKRRPHAQPWWQGEDISADGIVAWGEQGVGDEILYSSIVPDLAARARQLVLECEPRLVTLFSRSFAGVEVVAKRDPVDPRLSRDDLRWQTPFAHSLRWLRPTLASFPTEGGHLRADAAQVEAWRRRLAALGNGLNVGIAWRSKLMTKVRAHHFSSLEQWGGVLRVAGVHFVNLQYDDCRAELAAAAERFGVTIHAFTELDLMNDLDGAAALTSALDLVISPATSVGTMAGAVGVPTWMLVPQHLVWETFGTDRMPLVPSVRIIDRAWDASWDSVLDSVAEKLRDAMRDRASLT
jgi:tetratricopeptide (TPR) repeat protein